MRLTTMTEHLLMGGGLALIVAAVHSAEHQCDAYERVVDAVGDAVASMLIDAVLNGAL